jgi:hypothetical protein
MPQDTFVAPTIQPSGTTWAQFKTGGVGILLSNLAATNPPRANPTSQATVAVSGTTGLLPTGTYCCRYSFVDPFGETLASGESAPFNVTAGQVPTVTLPALPGGVQSINVYLTNPNGGAGTETLYATGVTTTTFACSYAPPPDQPSECMPENNSTGWPSTANLLATQANTELALESSIEKLSQVLSGRPIQRRLIFRDTIRTLGIVAAWHQIWAEAATLIWANLPAASVGYITTPVGQARYKWMLP